MWPTSKGNNGNGNMSCAHCDEPASLVCPCRSVRYCSRDCQKLCWKGHKTECLKLRESNRRSSSSKWFDWSPQELCRQCVAFLLRKRAAAEGIKPPPGTPERVARDLLNNPDLGPNGPTQMGKALDGARALFHSDMHAQPPAKGSPEANALQEKVADVTHHLVEGARCLMSDDHFEPFFRDWVRHLFDPETLGLC